MRLIDADKLIVDFEPEHRMDWYTPWIVEKIEEQPTVDAAPVVHGDWVKFNPHNRFMDCSVCGFYQDHTTFNYCPNCGAKMDGGDSNE